MAVFFAVLFNFSRSFPESQMKRSWLVSQTETRHAFPRSRPHSKGERSKDNANRAGFWNVLHRFKTDNSYATIMTATGRNEDDVAESDLMAVLHLPHLGRTHQQRSTGSGPFAGMRFKKTSKSCPACILRSKAYPAGSNFC